MEPPGAPASRAADPAVEARTGRAEAPAFSGVIVCAAAAGTAERGASASAAASGTDEAAGRATSAFDVATPEVPGGPVARVGISATPRGCAAADATAERGGAGRA